MLTGNVLITGGAGAMGRAIIHRAEKEGWDCKITIYSTDVMKHHAIQKKYPKVGAIAGDIRDITTLSNAMVGKDLVLHLAAQKHIPEGEFNSIDNYEVNVGGSMNVCAAALQLRIPKVLGISTDKVCHAANAYGASKYIMEKVFQEYSRIPSDTSFNLVRFGNVLESTGSVIEVWKKAASEFEPIKITNPNMTRFFLSPQQAVGVSLKSLEMHSGDIYIPKMKSLSIGKLAGYVLGEGYEIQTVPLRPGEKIHETLLALEECRHSIEYQDSFLLHPTTKDFHNPYHFAIKPFSSDIAPELSREELMELLKNE